MDTGETLRRKVSAKGQVRLPSSLIGTIDHFLAPEPGLLAPPDEIQLYPEDAPPEFDGPVRGEVIRIPTSTGQVTLPASFRDRAGIRIETEVEVTLRQDYIEITSVEPEE